MLDYLNLWNYSSFFTSEDSHENKYLILERTTEILFANSSNSTLRFIYSGYLSTNFKASSTAQNGIWEYGSYLIWKQLISL